MRRVVTLPLRHLTFQSMKESSTVKHILFTVSDQNPDDSWGWFPIDCRKWRYRITNVEANFNNRNNHPLKTIYSRPDYHQLALQIYVWLDYYHEENEALTDATHQNMNGSAGSVDERTTLEQSEKIYIYIYITYIFQVWEGNSIISLLFFVTESLVEPTMWILFNELSEFACHKLGLTFPRLKIHHNFQEYYKMSCKILQD